MKKTQYISPALQMICISGIQMIASSLDRSNPTNIDGITNGGTSSYDDEAGARANNYSIWDADWSK